MPSYKAKYTNYQCFINCIVSSPTKISNETGAHPDSNQEQELVKKAIKSYVALIDTGAL